MPDKQFRTLAIELDRADAKGRIFPASLSSEEPVERSFGFEILDHSPGAIDFSRARDGLPLLFQHDPARPLGMVENIRAEGTRLRADVKFFNTTEGGEALQMARDGLRTLSIGYLVNDMEQTGERDGRPVFRVTKWTPLESSLVTIPADKTVGIGRALPYIESKGNRNMEQLNEADRVKQLVALGDQFSRFMQPSDVRDAIDRGTTPDQFREVILTRMESSATDVRARAVGMTAREVERYSLARAIVASITGDWTHAGLEREASRALERTYGRNAEGFLMPGEIWRRDFNVGTSTEAGNLIQTELRTDLWTDALRAELVMGRLGVRFLPGLSGNVDIPRKSGVSSVGMLAEIGSASETNPTIAKVSLTPKRIGAYVEYSKQALVQSAIALEGMLRDDLLQSAAVKLEQQAINGVGSSNEMTGLRNTSGIGTVTAGANGATVAWPHFVDLEAACANANASPGALAGYITNTKVRAKAKTVPRGTNLDFIIPPDALIGPEGLVRVNGYRSAFSNNVPSNLTKGTSTTVCSAALFGADWSMGVIALFGAPDIVVDPYTLAATGQVRITVNQFADFGVRQPGAFAKIEDLLTA